jgi:hypothetical protein
MPIVKVGLTVAPTCQARLQEAIVDPVNDAVARNRQRKETEKTIRGIEARGRSHMNLVVKRMIEEAKKRRSPTLDEQAFEEAWKAVGPLRPLD